MSTKQAICELSLDSQILRDYLLKANGEVVTYDELSKAIGRDVQHEAAGNLQTAKRILLREHQIVFETVRNTGLKRMGAKGVVVAAKASVGKIHREAKRGAQKLACANYHELDNADRVQHNATAAALGALHAITGAGATKKLVAASEKANQALPLADTLKAFAGS